MKKMFRYRIYTEDRNYWAIMKKAQELFDGFTVYVTHGFWEEVKENSLVIEYLRYNNGLNLVIEFSQWLKDYNGQKSIMITSEEVDTEFV